MGLEFYNLSHRFGYQSPNSPYFEDVKIERIHYHAKSGVLSQRITASMHNTTHIDAPAHVVQGSPFIDEVPLPHFFGTGIVVSIPKKKWEPITYDDLEKAAGKVVRECYVVLVNTGCHKNYDDSEDYFCYAPGFVPSAGEWFVEKKVKVIGHDTQANDHPLATAIGPQRNGPLHPHLAAEYKKWSGGRDWKDDFPEWEPVHRILFKNGILGIENVGGELDKVTGRRCGPRRLAAREGLFCARGRADGDRRRQGDRAEEERFLRDRPEREPRDHQPRQRGVLDRGGGCAGREVKERHSKRQCYAPTYR